MYLKGRCGLSRTLKCDVVLGGGWVSEDDFVAIMRLHPEHLRKCLMVKFEGEDALNYGGVLPEWFFSLVRYLIRAMACSSIIITSIAGGPLLYPMLVHCWMLIRSL